MKYSAALIILFVLAALPFAYARPQLSSDLLVPYFEVDKTTGLSTSFAVGNAGGTSVPVVVSVYSNWGVKIFDSRFTLGPYDVQSASIGGWIVYGVLPDRTLTSSELEHIYAALSGQRSPRDNLYYSSNTGGKAIGFVEIRAEGARPDVLWGDYFILDPAENFAQGDVLVNIDRSQLCDGLCKKHTLRFMEGGSFDGGTEIMIWNNRKGTASASSSYPTLTKATMTARFYDEAGTLLRTRTFRFMPLETLKISDIKNEFNPSSNFGWVEFDSNTDSVMSVRYKAQGKLSVGLRSWCEKLECSTGGPPSGFCGDNLTNRAGETCDPPGSVPNLDLPNNFCRASCTYCGDGVRDLQHGESCDDGDTNDDTCRDDCTYCGDGVVQSTHGEECEPSLDTNCQNDCTYTQTGDCGDGTVDTGETCDPPGSTPPGSVNECRADCTYCGDGILNSGEECEPSLDPNCQSDCTLSYDACTPGYWKTHPGAWSSTGYLTEQSVQSVFAQSVAYPSIASSTLLQALDFSGGSDVEGGARILLRAAVAALLNAADPTLNYPVSLNNIIIQVNAALASGNRDSMISLAAEFDGYNNDYPCPKSAQLNKYYLTLRRGWNLISSPVYETGTKTLFSDFETTCTYGGPLLWYDPDSNPPGYKESGYITDSKKGFWINVSSDCTTTIEGDGFYTRSDYGAIQLERGWNFFGSIPAGVPISSLHGCTFDRGPYQYNPVSNQWETASITESGKGYLAYVTNSCTLTI